MGDEEEDDGEEQEDADLQVYNDGATAAAACWATNSPLPPTTKAQENKKKGEKERKKGAPRLSKRKSKRKRKRKRKTKGTYYSLRKSC